jgi:protein-S-isoprenylcysteine O-methyltransferase Ste14
MMQYPFSTNKSKKMKKYLVLVYSVICYAAGLFVLAYYGLFLAEVPLFQQADKGEGLSLAAAVSLNIFLLLAFSLQHSVMARKPFKDAVTRWIPEAAERSTYVLFSVLLLFLLIENWQSLPFEIYDFRGSAIGTAFWILYIMGWMLGLASTFQIDHFHLFGLKQAWFNFRNRANARGEFRMPFLYRLVRHPINLGWLVIHWMTPHMTADRLLMAAGFTVYIYISMTYEERDLIRIFGEKYTQYKKQVPQLIPVWDRVVSRILAAVLIALTFSMMINGGGKDAGKPAITGTGFIPEAITLRETPSSDLKELVDEQLIFLDSAGVEWIAPHGTLTDGASVPRLALWVTDGRFDNEFLKAAVIHDAYCQSDNETRCPDQYQTRPWKAVHRMFYEACLAGGTSPAKARIMFAAVWLGGPRWNDPERNLDQVPDEVLQAEFEACKKWMEEKDPTVEEVEAWMEKREKKLLAVQ